MNACSWCGNDELEPGFLEDRGEGSYGFISWIQGALERGWFGGAKRAGRSHWIVDARRCTECGHLEMFATQQTSTT